MNKTEYNASFGFLTNYKNGFFDNEIQYDILIIVNNFRKDTHYSRELGASLQNLEQTNELFHIYFIMYVVEQIYKLNVNRNFEPYIVVGYKDIEIEQEKEKMNITIKYRILQNINKQGEINERIQF